MIFLSQPPFRRPCPPRTIIKRRLGGLLAFRRALRGTLRAKRSSSIRREMSHWQGDIINDAQCRGSLPVPRGLKDTLQLGERSAHFHHAARQ